MFMFWIFTTIVVSFESYFFAMTDVSQIGNKDAQSTMESFIYIMWYNCAELEQFPGQYKNEVAPGDT